MLTSSFYAERLPLTALRKRFDLKVVDTNETTFFFECRNNVFLFGNSTTTVDASQDVVIYYPESYSPVALFTTQSSGGNDQSSIISDSWIVAYDALEATACGSNWVNPPLASRIADNKALLVLKDWRPAFCPPLETLISNRGVSVRNLADEDGVAVKLASRHTYLDNETVLTTQFFSALEIDEYFGDISTCPLIYQPFIEAPTQLRVFVFWDRAISYWIRSSHSRQHPDVRVLDWSNFTLSPAQIDQNKVDEVIRFVRNELHIHFAALDFLEHDSNLYLVDINPNGSWAWLPEADRIFVEEVFLDRLSSYLQGGRNV